MRRVFDTEKKIYTLAILVEDIAGILSQVARLFSRKGYNIESIVSGETDRPGITRISIEVIADELMIDQIAAQCRKLIGVKNVKILDSSSIIRRSGSCLFLDDSDGCDCCLGILMHLDASGKLDAPYNEENERFLRERQKRLEHIERMTKDELDDITTRDLVISVLKKIGCLFQKLLFQLHK